MPTAYEFYETDFSGVAFDTEVSFLEGSEHSMLIGIVADSEAGVIYRRAYIPEEAMPVFAVISSIITLDNFIKLAEGVSYKKFWPNHDEESDIKDFIWSPRFIVYTPYQFSEDDVVNLREIAKEKGIDLILRDSRYVAARNDLQKAYAFISHDSRDKDPFVKGIAHTLRQMLCPVWYDEFSLRPGQSLRNNIESGLKLCRGCVLVITKNYLENKTWAKQEFETIYSRSVLKGDAIIIPIWLGVSKEEVYEYSPILCDILGIDGSIGIEETAKQIVRGLFPDGRGYLASAIIKAGEGNRQGT